MRFSHGLDERCYKPRVAQSSVSHGKNDRGILLCLQDDLINRLGGVEKVAELTGRRKRMVCDEKTGSYHYRARFDKVPMDQVVLQVTRHICNARSDAYKASRHCKKCSP